MGYLVIKNNNVKKSYLCTNTCNKPRIKVSNSYIPLTNNNKNGLRCKVNNSNVAEYLSYTSTNNKRTITTGTTYLTRESWYYEYGTKNSTIKSSTMYDNIIRSGSVSKNYRLEEGWKYTDNCTANMYTREDGYYNPCVFFLSASQTTSLYSGSELKIEGSYCDHITISCYYSSTKSSKGVNNSYYYTGYYYVSYIYTKGSYSTTTRTTTKYTSKQSTSGTNYGTTTTYDKYTSSSWN